MDRALFHTFGDIQNPIFSIAYSTCCYLLGLDRLSARKPTVFPFARIRFESSQDPRGAQNSDRVRSESRVGAANNPLKSHARRVDSGIVCSRTFTGEWPRSNSRARVATLGKPHSDSHAGIIKLEESRSNNRTRIVTLEWSRSKSPARTATPE